VREGERERVRERKRYIGGVSSKVEQGKAGQVEPKYYHGKDV